MFITVKEMALIMGVSESTILRWLRTGKLQVKKFAGQYVKSSFEKAIQQIAND